MDATDLHKLAGHLRDHGLQVVALDPEMRLHATNPLHGPLTEEIVAVNGRYVTSFKYEIGEQGHEKDCADRIAQLLTAKTPLRQGAAVASRSWTPVTDAAGWCDWHKGPSGTAVLIGIVGEKSGPATSRYACAPCREQRGLRPDDGGQS
ncbi:hypothetical protein [Streptomyces sp. NPDC056255]|uniref:hypothetical protein n=1 Tax=Streptomyces sp. NPDC056255 TaxID=3345764 RepID=UPI0035DEDAD9